MPTTRYIPPTAEIAHQIQRYPRSITVPYSVQGSGHSDVVDVVTRPLSQRASAAPSGHSPIHQARIHLSANLRAQADAFSHPRTIALHQHIGLLNQLQSESHGRRVLEIEDYGSFAPVEQIFLRLARKDISADRPIDPHHVGTEVGQKHGRKRAWAQPGQFDDPHTCKRPSEFRLIGIFGSHGDPFRLVSCMSSLDVCGVCPLSIHWLWSIGALRRRVARIAGPACLSSRYALVAKASGPPVRENFGPIEENIRAGNRR